MTSNISARIQLESLAPGDIKTSAIAPLGNVSEKDPSLQFITVKFLFETFCTYTLKFWIVKEFDKTKIMVEYPESFKERLVHLNECLATALEQKIAGVHYKPFTNSNFDYVSFNVEHVAGLAALNITRLGQRQTVIGHDRIVEELHGKEITAALQFDITCIYRKGDVIGCRPKLVNVLDWTDVQ